MRQKMADLVQRYFDKLEVGGSRNLRRLNKKCKFCALGRLTPLSQYRLGREWLVYLTWQLP